MQLCLSERTTLGAWMFVHDRLTPTTAVALSMLQTRSDIRLAATPQGVRALATIIVAKHGHSQARTTVLRIVGQ
jgi:hypothetical protein